jgi:hypothetical protein
MCLATLHTLGQAMQFTVGESVEETVTNVPKSESINTEVYNLVGHFSCADELQQTIWNDFNGLQTVITINGKTIKTEGFTDLSYLYSFQAEEGETYLMKPSIRIDIPLDQMILYNAPFMKPTGNKLSVTTSFNETVLGTGILSFDIPEFAIPDGDFCLLKPNYLSGEQAVLEAIANAFNADFSGVKPIKIWLPFTWMELEDGSTETTGVVLFGTDENYSTSPYKVTKSNGKIEVMVNKEWLRESIHPDCVKAFLAN